VLKTDSDLEWVFIDGSYVKAHQHSVGAAGGYDENIGKSRAGRPFYRCPARPSSNRWLASPPTRSASCSISAIPNVCLALHTPSCVARLG
jgi:hypothetical protein